MKKPDIHGSFKLMDEWDYVTKSPENDEAVELYNHKKIDCNLKNIARENSKLKLLAFLRYDYKKTLVRTRYLYIDRLWQKETKKIQGGELGKAYFEPILICFPNLEFLGRIRYPDLYSSENRNTTKILQEILRHMGQGYKIYAKELTEWHRHALSHELRPDGNWIYDLDTEEKYLSPRMSGDQMLYLNIPHFIDSCIFELENICDDLLSPNDQGILDNFISYMHKKSEKQRPTQAHDSIRKTR